MPLLSFSFCSCFSCFLHDQIFDSLSSGLASVGKGLSSAVGSAVKSVAGAAASMLPGLAGTLGSMGGMLGFNLFPDIPLAADVEGRYFSQSTPVPSCLTQLF